MPIRENSALRLTVAELAEVNKKLQGKRIPFYDSSKGRLIVVPPVESGLWPQCERLTIQAFTQIRSKRDWGKAKDLCIRTPKTEFLYDVLERHFAPPRKNAKV